MNISRILENPYQRAGAVLAKVAVNLATAIWSIMVLAHDDTLRPHGIYAPLLELAPENAWAGGLLLLALFQLGRLCLHRPPMILGLGYLFMAAFWLYVWFNILMQTGRISPAAFACVSVVTMAALFAFIANPKRRHDAPADDC